MEENKAMGVEKKKIKKKSKIDWLGSVGLTLILAAAVLMIWFFLNGETKVEGGFSEGTRSESLTCTTEGAIYPFFRLDESTSKKIEVKVLFSEDRFSSISLIATLFYPDLSSAKKSEMHNHTEMDKSFGAAGLGADAYNTNFSAQEDRAQMTLYATSSEYNEVAARYFMANGTNKNSTVDDFTKALNSKGFNCTIVK